MYDIYSMNLKIPIIPITQARTRLSDLLKTVQRDDYVILTKGGSPKAALVDIAYLQKLEQEVQTLYKKTFIDPTLLPFTREFSNEEIAAWQKEDQLP